VRESVIYLSRITNVEPDAEIRDARELHNISKENKGQVNVFPPSRSQERDDESEEKEDPFGHINDETVKFLVKVLLMVVAPFVCVAACYWTETFGTLYCCFMHPAGLRVNLG
jgi:hypothetical protein